MSGLPAKAVELTSISISLFDAHRPVRHELGTHQNNSKNIIFGDRLLTSQLQCALNFGSHNSSLALSGFDCCASGFHVDSELVAGVSLIAAADGAWPEWTSALRGCLATHRLIIARLGLIKHSFYLNSSSNKHYHYNLQTTVRKLVFLPLRCMHGVLFTYLTLANSLIRW